MNELTLQWTEAGQSHVRTLYEQQATKHPGTVRIGRDPTRCDIVLSHPTVSGLHIEIFFKASTSQFYVRNLRDTNPPIIDGNLLQTGEVLLNLNSHLQLGQQELQVIAISQPEFVIPPTVLLSPDQLLKPISLLQNPLKYGLQCSKCDRIAAYQHLDLGCPWCGTSLAAAISVVLSGEN